MERQVDASQMTDIELKALAYEQVKLLQTAQHNVAKIEEELVRRARAQSNADESK